VQLRPVRQDAVHRKPVALEVVARRVEDEEVHTGDRLGALLVARGRRGPGERIVERVEVGALRNRGSPRVERAVGTGEVLLQARGRLDRRAVPEAAGALELLYELPG